MPVYDYRPVSERGPHCRDNLPFSGRDPAAVPDPPRGEWFDADTGERLAGLFYHDTDTGLTGWCKESPGSVPVNGSRLWVHWEHRKGRLHCRQR